MFAIKVSAKVFIPGPDFIKDNINKTAYPIDSTADAIVLYEKVYFTINNAEHGLSQHKYVKKIIKILTDAGKSYANIMDEAYYNDYMFADYSKPAGTTYNWDGNAIVASKLDAKTSKVEAENSNYVILKFSMPDVKVGSIIEYEYILDEPMMYVFGFWNYQEALPKIYSEVEVTNENKIKYSDFSQTIYPFKRFNDAENSEADVPDAYYTSFSTGATTEHRRWVRRNVLAYKPEPLMSNMYNYTEKIMFQTSVMIWNTFNPIYFSSNITWNNVNSWYLKDNYFLKELDKPNAILTNTVPVVTNNTHDSLQLAKNIYKYVRDSFTNTSDIKPRQSLRNMLDERKGGMPKMNLVLIGMLRVAGINCEPVLISTTEHMKLRGSLPMTNLINYMATKVHINDKDYFLDPTSKYNPFGVLPYNCYNGYARVIDEDSGYAVDLNPDFIVDKDVVTINTASADPENYLLKFRHFYGNAYSPGKRRQWVNDSALLRDELVKSLSPGFQLIDYKIENLTNPDSTLIVDYTVKMSWGNTIYMSPVLLPFYASTPFKAKERQYPIEFPYAKEDIYILNMQLPKGYSCADSVTSSNYTFDDKTGIKYMAAYDTASNTLQVNAHFSLRETYFEAHDYKPLKNFFDDILSLQQTAYLFKKN